MAQAWTFRDYQKQAATTAVYPKIMGNNLIYPVIGLGGEVGEFQNKFKKVFRDKDAKISPQMKADLVDELGDVLWYMSQIATELGVDFNQVVETNVNKLAARRAKGTIHGSGDQR